MDDVAKSLAAQFPGSRIRPAAYGGNVLVYEVDGCWHDARVVERGALEIFVTTMPAPGMTITIEGIDRKAEEPASMAALRVQHDDDPIAALWLDAPAERALVSALWTATTNAALLPTLVYESFRYVVADGQVAVSRRAHDPDTLHRAFVAASTLAARPQRIARAWLDVAHGLGGTTTSSRWDLADLGGEFAVTIDRGAAPVRVDNLRRLPGDDDDHAGLYTRVRARRVAAEGDRWAIWRRDVPRQLRPQAGRGLRPVPLDGLDALATDPARLGKRLERHGALLDAAAPHAIATIDDVIELWWPGLVQAPERVGPAVELLSRLGGEVDAAVGPYR